MTHPVCRILILGTGGVGGYIGGLLAYHSSGAHAEVIFFSRGENLNAIKSNGLNIMTDHGDVTAYPTLITNDVTAVGRIDLLLCCMKGYDLEDSLKPLIPHISKETIVIPFLNGINARERIKKILPHGKIWEGCIYVVSRLIAPGVIKQSGSLNQIFFGSDTDSIEKLKYVENIFSRSYLKAGYSDTMTVKLWEKFYFISAMATVTSYFNSPIGEIQSDPAKSHFIMDLLLELEKVTSISKIELPSGLVERSYARIMTLNPETTSSMLEDFRKGGKTEIEEITGYVVHKSREMNIATPVYNMMYRNLCYSVFKPETTKTRIIKYIP